MHRALLPGALMILTLGSTSARAEDPLVAAGHQVADRWCVNCHVVSPGQTRGGDQAPPFRSIAERPGTTAASVRAFLELPNHRMPYQNLSNVELDAVTAYILALKH